MTERNRSIVFMSFVGPHYSRSATLLNYPQTNLEKSFIQTSNKTPYILFEIMKNFKYLRRADTIVIMSPCHKITLFARICLGNKIILDAGWPLLDGFLARKYGFRKFLSIPVSYLKDLVAFHSSSFILVESEMQLVRIARHFFIPKKKMRVSYTGVNESAFSAEESKTLRVRKIQEFHIESGRSSAVLFRGKINHESGISNIIGAARILETSSTFIFLSDTKINAYELPANCMTLTDASIGEMIAIYRSVDLCLGQLSNHHRLKLTIPHKAFEAGFFGIPYITTKKQGDLGFLDDKSAVFIENPNPSEIAEGISSLAESALRKDFSHQIKRNYESSVSQSRINEHFKELVMLKFYSH